MYGCFNPSKTSIRIGVDGGVDGGEDVGEDSGEDDGGDGGEYCSAGGEGSFLLFDACEVGMEGNDDEDVGSDDEGDGNDDVDGSDDDNGGQNCLHLTHLQ